MKIQLSKKEKNLLVRVAVVLAILLGAGRGIEFGYGKYEAEERKENTSLKRQRTDLTERLATINEEERLQQEFATSYQGFVDQGFIGDEPRLEWIAKIQEIVRKRRLYNVSYALGNRVSHAPSSFDFTAGSTINVQSTGMNISMPMLHDLDFLMFLDDYAANVPGVFIPISCSMSGGTRTKQFEVELKENFRADCKVEWLTVEDPDRGKQGT